MSDQKNVLVAPSVLAADLSRLADEVRDVEQARADWLHVDVMDGVFVPPISFGVLMAKTLRGLTSLPLDVHLMVVNPEHHVPAFIEAGCDTITFHYEATPHSHRLLSEIRAAGVKAGITINPGTPVSCLFALLEAVDMILIMSVNPGWSGQPFIPESLRRIERLRNEIEKRGAAVKIEVDGGINETTARSCIAAGADILVAGDFVFGSRDRKERIALLKRNAERTA